MKRKHYFKPYHRSSYPYGPMQDRFLPNSFNVKKLVYSPEAINGIIKTVGSRPAESGGAQFGRPLDLRSPYPYITKFFYDPGKNATRATYTIDEKRVNRAIHDEWETNGLEYIGQLHSHPYGCRFPSVPDMDYFHEMHTYMDRPFLITPIVFTNPDGGFQMFCYLVGPDTPAIPVDYCVMDEAEYRAFMAEVNRETAEAEEVIEEVETAEAEETVTAAEAVTTEEAVATATAEETESVEETGTTEGPEAPESTEETDTAEVPEAPETTEETEEAEPGEKPGKPLGIDYTRQRNAVDQAVQESSRVITVGCGGSEKVNLDLPRTGVKEIVLIDPDRVDRTNLCRQGYLPRQVGMYKVDAIAEMIKEIDPDVKVTTYPVKVQDLTPEQEKAIFTTDGTDIKQIVAVFVTDSFEAQAHGNKLALRYNIPAIWAGFYEKSLASEIFFYIPGVTPGCFRCAVSPRYKFQEEYIAKNGGKPFSVSSDCNTIFHSALLDAQIGMLILAILHNKVEGKTFSGWFGDHFDRNFVQMNVNPGYKSDLFGRVFAGAADNTFLFESVWQHIEPERPPKYDLCPDCHGGLDYHLEDPAE